MKYIVVDQTKTDMFISEHETKEAAIAEARSQWDSLSEYDQAKREEFYVLESVNLDEDAEDHYDGDLVLILKSRR